jgi:hypothetical protein
MWRRRGLQNQNLVFVEGSTLVKLLALWINCYFSFELFISCRKFMRLQGDLFTKFSSQTHTTILYSISLFSGIHVLQPVLGSYQDIKHCP